ncbi:MAG: VTT domain-containing protein [Proteobacteria bacterium]|nr:VTT domain-containing protein [Pseudomonadota bacterium]
MSTALSRWCVGLVLLALMAGAWMYKDHFDARALTTWIENAGAAAPLLFIAIYAVATVLFLPGIVITFVGGALFGPAWGTLWNLCGATLGAAIAFVIARHLGADWVTRHAGPRLRRLDEGVSKEGWRFVAFVRLVPLLPFNLLNYALGLTRISFRDYVLATAVFMLPGAVAYTWLGHAGSEALHGGEFGVRKLLVAVALIAATLFIPRLVRTLREPPMLTVETLRAELESGARMLLIDVRPAADFRGEWGHIPGARSVPLEALPGEFDERDHDRAIRLVCRTDRRSSQAKDVLTRAGYTDVRVVQGGMSAWRERGWAVER